MSPAITKAVAALQEKFINETAVLSAFNPTTQVSYARDVQRCHFGDAPNVKVVELAYGRKTAMSWMEIQLFDLSAFAGCKEKLSQAQISETAAMMLDGYPHYKLTEFMLFFQRFKRCEYGKFYGAVDPMVILQALSTFDEQRAKAVYEKEQQERKAQQLAEEQEYQALRQRYGQRVPDAWTENAPLTFMQYRLMGYDSMTDERLALEIADIRSGKELPQYIQGILATLQDAFISNSR